jgi:hypothetical protein
MAASVAKKFADLKRETLTQWRSWAQSIADGGATPSPMAVLESAAVLGIPEPMAALEADANAISEASAIEWQIKATAEKIEERLAPYGGEAGLRAKIAETRRELDRMIGLAGPEKWIQHGRMKGDLGRLRGQHPRVFGEIEPAPKTTRRKGGDE